MLAGQLTDFSIDDIFQLLALTKKSGALRVDTSEGEGHIYWADGAVFFATADVRRLALGARLVGAGALTEQQLREIAAQRERGGPVEFAAALLSSDLVDEATVETFLADQVNESVGRLLRQTEGAFNFDGEARVDGWPGPSFGVEDLLAEGHRRLGEWETISANIPSLDRPLALIPTLASDDIAIAADQWQLLALIDGERTAKDLVDLTGKGEFATCKVLAALVSAGLVELRPADGRTALEELLTARQSLRKLEEVALARPVRLAPAAPTPAEPSEPSETTEPVAASAEPEGASPGADEHGGHHDAPRDDADAATDAEPGEDDVDGAPEESVDPGAEDTDHADHADHGGHTDVGDQDDHGDGHHEDAPHAEGDNDTDDGGHDDGDRHDDPPAPRRDLNVDRAQMARELASLGLNDAEPLRRTVHRASAAKPARGGQANTAAETAAEAGAEDDEAPVHTAEAAEATAEQPRPTMTEHRLSRDNSMNRGMLLRLIDGIQGS